MARRRAYPPSVVPGIPRLGKKPRGWREVSFSDVLRVVERPAEVLPDQKYQLVNAKRSRGGIVPREVRLGKQIKTKTQFYVKANDFLISRRQIIHGACGIVPSELDGALVSNEYSTLVPREGLLLEYLGYYSHSIHFQQTCFHSSVGVDVEKMVFKLDSWLKHRFYLPPLNIQEEVVRILSTADRAIDRTEKLIAAKRELKKGLSEQLLSGERRLPGFGKPVRQEPSCNGVNCGQIPAEWECVQLGTLGQTFAGLSGKSRSDFGKGAPYIPYLNVFENACIDEERMDRVMVGPDERQNEVAYGDIFFTTSSETRLEVGMASVLLTELPKTYLNSFCFGFRMKDFNRLIPRFAGYLLRGRAIRAAIARLAQGATRYNLPQQAVMRLQVPLPPSAEQERLAAILSAADREIILLQRGLVVLRELKKGLMQKLLDGGA